MRKLSALRLAHVRIGRIAQSEGMHGLTFDNDIHRHASIPWASRISLYTPYAISPLKLEAAALVAKKMDARVASSFLLYHRLQ